MTTRVLPVLAMLTMLFTVTWAVPPLASAATLTVTDCGDSGGPNQLRQVIAAAASGDTVTVPACTITLTTPASPLTINKNLTITGAGAQQTIVDGGGITQISSIVTGTTVAISDMTLRNGNGAPFGFGGGIENRGALTLTNVVVTGNTTSGQGGGINGQQGTLTIVNSTVSGNHASGGAGGLIAFTSLTLTNSTVSGNSAPGAGAMGVDGLATLVNDTISGNVGGGITVNSGSPVTIKNTIIANNSCHIVSGTITSNGHNLESGNSCGFSAALGDLVNTNPMLGPLQLNGGPTPTQALLPGSPAIDAGDNAGCPVTDQRGVPRPLETTLGFRLCDIGAFEVETLGFIHATLSLNTGTISPGTSLQGTVSVTNDGGARPLDVYFFFLPPAAAGPGLGCPVGDAVFFLAVGGVTLTCVSSGVQTFAPALHGVTLAADLFAPISVPIFSLPWPGVPTGGWLAGIALTPVGAFSDGRVNPLADLVIATAGFVAGP